MHLKEYLFWRNIIFWICIRDNNLKWKRGKFIQSFEQDGAVRTRRGWCLHSSSLKNEGTGEWLLSKGESFVWKVSKDHFDRKSILSMQHFMCELEMSEPTCQVASQTQWLFTSIWDTCGLDTVQWTLWKTAVFVMLWSCRDASWSCFRWG